MQARMSALPTIPATLTEFTHYLQDVVQIQSSYWLVRENNIFIYLNIRDTLTQSNWTLNLEKVCLLVTVVFNVGINSKVLHFVIFKVS